MHAASRIGAIVVGLAVGIGCGPRQRDPVPPATGVAPQAAAPAVVGPRMTLEPDRIVVDDDVLALPKLERLQRIDALFQAIRAAASDDGAQQPYHLTVADEVRGLELKSAFQTAAFAGWRPARLDVLGVTIVMHAMIPSLTDRSTDAGISWPQQTLVVVVRDESVELWRAPNARHGTPSHEAVLAGTVPLASLDDEMPSLFERECRRAACSPAVLYVADEGEFSLVRRTLRSLAQATGDLGQDLILQFRVSDPGAPAELRRLRIEAVNVAGRLPPALIQEKVREKFSLFRGCYEAGLAKEPTLAGKVVVRFVIGGDGRVSTASTTDGTTLPDARVIDCIVDGYRELVFPPPEGGIVTVVYPIQFDQK